MDPENSVRIASFSYQAVCSNSICVVFLNKLSIIIVLFDNSYCSWSHVKTCNFILFTNPPHCTSIWSYGLTLIKNGSSTSDQWTINDKTMSHNPSDITSSKMNTILLQIKNVFHAIVKADTCASLITANTFWCTCCS